MSSRKCTSVVSVVGMICLVVVLVYVLQPKAALAETPYDMEIKPLTTAECAQCHFSVFEAIKAEGGKHQIDCVRCHTEYHVYSPRKQNFDQIMPKCSACHLSASGGAFHGEAKDLTPCLNCHADHAAPPTRKMKA